MIEPWLSGSHSDVPALLRPLIHSMEHAQLDLARWTEGFTSEEIWARPMDLGAVGFHMRHIAGSTDRLFTYLQGRQLSETQMFALRYEMDAEASREELLAELDAVFARVATELVGMDVAVLSEARGVGRKLLPTTVHGLLVHMSEHMMRHVGAAIVTAKVVRYGRG